MPLVQVEPKTAVDAAQQDKIENVFQNPVKKTFFNVLSTG